MTETNCCHSSSEDGPDIEKNLTDTFCQVNKRYEHHLNTSNVYQTLNLPDRFERSYIFNGYGYQRKNASPYFRTSNSEYGWLPPNPHTVPQRYFPRTNEFSTLLARCGMYRNFSLNTTVDRRPY